MATKKMPKGNTEADALSPDAGITVPRIGLKEQGFVGLKARGGRIYDEANTAFQYPQFIRTVNEMRHNPTVGGAMNVYRMMMSRVNWDIVENPESSEIDHERVEILRTMLYDMEHSFRSFIEEVIPYLEYGFGIHEKVLRRRLYSNGSKYNDGLVGIRKLSPRNQDTIVNWNFSEDGANLESVEQSIQNLEDSYRFAAKQNNNGLITIDREKFLLFTASSNKGNPQGNSIYKAVYLAYKQLSLLQEQELLGVAKDVQGILKIGVPPAYLNPNGSDSEKASAAAFQSIINNYNAGTQAGLLVPVMSDPESKQQMFTYDLMESKGGSKYDVDSVIKRLQSDILSALSVDVLKMGADGTGSFSLAESKSSILAIAIDYRLREIAEVLNFDLIPSIYAANGWSQENLPKFTYEDIEQVSLDEFSSAVQRIVSVGALELDREVMNRVRQVFGVSPRSDDDPVDKDELSPAMTGKSSRAGDGMKTAGDGTSTSPIGSGDSSVSNTSND